MRRRFYMHGREMWQKKGATILGRISTYLNELKSKCNLTQQQLSDVTGIPIGTLPRYFGHMDDDSASFEIVRKLVVAMNGSLDELAGIQCDKHPPPEPAYTATVAVLEARLKEKDERIAHRDGLLSLERERAEKAISLARRREQVAMLISYVALALFVVLFIIDFLIPTRGWIIR